MNFNKKKIVKYVHTNSTQNLKKKNQKLNYIYIVHKLNCNNSSFVIAHKISFLFFSILKKRYTAPMCTCVVRPNT